MHTHACFYYDFLNTGKMPLSRTRRSKKTPLVFTESPVESRQTPVTPVLCADRPVTATSVSISDHSNQPWVNSFL